MPKGDNTKRRCPELERNLLDAIAKGASISESCEKFNIDINTFQRWRLDDPHFHAEATRAIELGHESLADQLLTIADRVPDVQRARLQSENIKWLLERRARARYGTQIDINQNVTVDIKDALADARSRVLFVARPVIAGEVVAEDADNEADPLS